MYIYIYIYILKYIEFFFITNPFSQSSSSAIPCQVLDATPDCGVGPLSVRWPLCVPIKEWPQRGAGPGQCNH